MKEYKAKLLTTFETYSAKADTIEEVKQKILHSYNEHNETSYTLEELENKYTIRIDRNDEPVYISYDGKEFDTDRERGNYEYEQRYIDAMKVEQIKAAEGLCPPAEIKYEENTAYWFKPNSYNDIVTLNRFLADVPTGYGRGAWTLKPQHIGKVFCVEVDETQPQKTVWVSSEEECIEKTKKLLVALGYDAVITKRENKQ